MFLKISEHFCLHSTILLEHLLAFEIIHETHKTKLIGMVHTEVKPIDWTHFFPRRESANVTFEERKPCKLKGTIIQSMIPLITAQMKRLLSVKKKATPNSQISMLSEISSPFLLHVHMDT